MQHFNVNLIFTSNVYFFNMD